jgi:hypothetical protein
MKMTLLTLRHLFVKLTAPFRKLRQQAIESSLSENGNPPMQLTPEKPPDPKSSQEAHFRLHQILNTVQPLQQMSYEDFLLGWVAMAYISPGLNPDEAGAEDGGWPPGWQPVAAEAFRRFELKELTKEELYPHPY